MSKRILTAVLTIGLVLSAMTIVSAQGSTSNWSHVTISGAGASFPFPIYSQWAYDYEELTGMKLNYQSVGSGAGVSAIQAKTVNFGATDAPMQAADLNTHGLVQFPMIIGGVVPVINVPGINPGEMKLTADVFARIYLGEITVWNDQAITSINSGLRIPDKDIVVVHRADGSGTTWILTNYLGKVSSAWAERVGIGKSVDWPVGIGGQGNEGVSNYVGRVDGAIGYVEYAYALQNNLTYCQLKNKAGNFVQPTADSFAAAAANADWANAPGYYLVLVDQPGADSWPITGASFILMHKIQPDWDKARAMLEFFDWCYREGQDSALALDYVPIPMNVVDMVEKTWRDNIQCAGRSVW